MLKKGRTGSLCTDTSKQGNLPEVRQPGTYGRRACTVTPSSRNAAPAVSPRGTRSSGRLQDGGAAWLQRVKLACLLRCLVAVCGAASLLRTRRCARMLHKCSKRQLAQLLRHAPAAKCALLCDCSPTANRTFPQSMPATRLVVHKLLSAALRSAGRWLGARPHRFPERCLREHSNLV